MSADDLNESIYLPNGNLNAPYVLSNASLLLKEGEVDMAASLFKQVTGHPKLGHCGHYGIGKCFMKIGKPAKAVAAFEAALLLQRRPYIAASLLEALIALQEYTQAEKRALEFAREFVADPESIERFRSLYRECTAQK